MGIPACLSIGLVCEREEGGWNFLHVSIIHVLVAKIKTDLFHTNVSMGSDHLRDLWWSKLY
jgi:hypothetical protein